MDVTVCMDVKVMYGCDGMYKFMYRCDGMYRGESMCGGRGMSGEGKRSRTCVLLPYPNVSTTHTHTCIHVPEHWKCNPPYTCHNETREHSVGTYVFEVCSTSY